MKDYEEFKEIINMDVRTFFPGEDKILQIVEAVYREKREILIREVYNTREKQFRDALVSLGWTPPPLFPKEKKD